MRPYSQSRLTDLNQCPIYGVVHIQRKYATTGRAMALEAGGTMHEVFSAVRLWQLWRKQGLTKHADYNGQRLFGQERWADAFKSAQKIKGDDRDQLLDLAYHILHSSEWYDDPNDNARTMANMEIASLRYIDRRLATMDSWPIFVEDKKRIDSRVGIEQVFDCILEYEDSTRIRFIGTIDGLIYSEHFKKWFLDENKTATRLDEGWRMSFEMSHQITGYCACSTTVFGFPVFDAHVFGIKIKPSGREDSDDFTVKRTPDSILHWAAWVWHTVKLFERYANDFESAPRFTHSCNRYFRPCHMIPFCSDTPEGRQQQWEEMVPQEPSPSERAVMEQF